MNYLQQGARFLSFEISSKLNQQNSFGFCLPHRWRLGNSVVVYGAARRWNAADQVWSGPKKRSRLCSWDDYISFLFRRFWAIVRTLFPLGRARLSSSRLCFHPCLSAATTRKDARDVFHGQHLSPRRWPLFEQRHLPGPLSKSSAAKKRTQWTSAHLPL